MNADFNKGNSNSFGSGIFDLDSDMLKSVSSKYVNVMDLNSTCKIQTRNFVSNVFNRYSGLIKNKENIIMNNLGSLRAIIAKTIVNISSTDSQNVPNGNASLTNGNKVISTSEIASYHYFAQNDARWGSTRYKNSNISGGACEAMSLVNTVANLGFYNTYGSEEELVTKIASKVSNGDNDFSSVVSYLNNVRKKSGKPVIKVTSSTRKDICSNLDSASYGDVVYCSSSKIESVSDFCSLYKNISSHAADNGYGVEVYTYGASAKKGAFTQKGHYLAISGVETQNGNVTGIYVADSFQRKYEEYNGVTSEANAPFTIIKPGMVLIPTLNVDELMDCGRIVVKKVEANK